MIGMSGSGMGYASAVGFFLMGLLLSFFYVNKQMGAADLLRNGRRTQGTIVDATGGNNKGPVKIRYRFEANGEEHEFWRISNLVRQPQVGTSLRVTYDPNNPKRCVSEFENAVHEFAVLFLITGILCVVFAGMRFWLLYRSSRKPA